jgi:hypothetical protein
MNCTICGLLTGNIVGSVLPQCKCGWQAPQPPKAQRQWVRLTDEEIVECWARPTMWATVHAIETKLKQKNGYAEENK